MPNPTRLYLRTDQLQYRRLAWFQNNKPNEMLVGIYGLSKKQPTLKYMWPERELESDDLGAMRYQYNDAIEVGRVVDHITCHEDGKFHIKTRNEEEIYFQKMRRTEALGPNTCTFLEMLLISDISENYLNITKHPKGPHVWVDLPDYHYISFKCMFSGANYDVERDMAENIAQSRGIFGGVRLSSGTIKGVMIGQVQRVSESAMHGKPHGTILSFKFPVEDDLWHIKTFLFE